MIFGAGGFIGRSLSKHLNDRGYVTITPSSQECDLLNAKHVFHYLASLKMPVRIAFCAGIILQKGNTFETMVKNIQMIESLGEVIENFDIQSLIFLSSTCVYNYSTEPITEHTPISPQSYYGISKIAGEHLLRMLKSFEMPVTILRLPGIYGVGDCQLSTVGLLLKQLMKDGHVTIFGDGQNQRDYVAIQDICRLIEHFLCNPYDEIFNVATGHSISINNLVSILGKAMHIIPQISYNNTDDSPHQHFIYDITHLRKYIPTFKFTSICDGLVDYVSALTCTQA